MVGFDSFRGRLIAAMVLGGCRSEAVPVTVVPETTVDAQANANVEANANADAQANANADAQANANANVEANADANADVRANANAPRAGTCADGKSPHESCFPPRTNVRSTGTGEPAPPPPPNAFDKNGCLPSTLVTTGCCNPAENGPRFKGGQCCYSFCNGPCCGRPFLIEGAPRVAEVVGGGSDDVVANEWLQDALMEHASIAAFSRFVLQLIQLGAPADLVRDATTAATDEARHAELCFGLAKRFGAYRRPAPFPLGGAFGAWALDDVLEEVVVEGCIGETIAALTAMRQLEVARDREVRAALAIIAEDEAKHAELAWRFVTWALESGADAERLNGLFSRYAKAPRMLATAIDLDRLHAAGRLGAAERVDVAARAIAEVILPCAAQLTNRG